MKVARLTSIRLQRVLFACLAACLSLAAVLGCSPSRADEVRIATWNLEHLAETNGTGCRARQNRDYALLRQYVDELDADIIAFQEVENTAAAERVFDPSEYTIEISNRPATEDSPCYKHPERRQTAIKVGFAIRKDIQYTRNPDLKDLANGRRRGMDITLLGEKSTLRLLTVHLASGCYSNTQDEQDDKDCDILNAQIPFLEQWLDARTREEQPALALGDFNRRLTKPNDRVWADLNDATPAPYALLTMGHVQACAGRYEGAPYIDHLIANHLALGMVRSRLIMLRFDATERNAPSDHCPIAVDVEFDF